MWLPYHYFLTHWVKILSVPSNIGPFFKETSTLKFTTSPKATQPCKCSIQVYNSLIFGQPNLSVYTQYHGVAFLWWQNGEVFPPQRWHTLLGQTDLRKGRISKMCWKMNSTQVWAIFRGPGPPIKRYVSLLLGQTPRIWSTPFTVWTLGIFLNQILDTSL